MAKPRVFISSTYFDLRHIRSSLETFIVGLGYEAILSEKGAIAYDPSTPLDESCYRDAAVADIFVLIIGGRYGSAASDNGISEPNEEFNERYTSITRKEYEAASKASVPTYILIQKNVFSEYETYLNNKDNETVKYAHVDSVNVFSLIESIVEKRKNNPIFQFELQTEIENWLRDQWSGLFKELLSRRSQAEQIDSMNERIAELSSVSNSLSRYMQEMFKNIDNEVAKRFIDVESKRVQDERLKATHTNDPVVGFITQNFPSGSRSKNAGEAVNAIIDSKNETEFRENIYKLTHENLSDFVTEDIQELFVRDINVIRENAGKRAFKLEKIFESSK